MVPRTPIHLLCGLRIFGLVLAILACSPGLGRSQDVIKITAEALGKEYDTDTKAADKKYEGKALEVTGTVSQIDTFLSRPYVGLVGSKNLFGIRGYTKEKQPWA